MTTMTSPLGVPEWDLIDRLHKAMREAGVRNASEMGALLGMHRNSIQDYLKGKRKPDHRTILAWAMACHVSAEWLESGTTPTGGGPGNGASVTNIGAKSSKWRLGEIASSSPFITGGKRGRTLDRWAA